MDGGGSRTAGRLTQAYLDALAWRFGGAGRIADLYPATPLQQGMLFHADLDADASAYVTCLTWTFRGRIEPELYRAAWAAVVERHDILRTAFDGLDLDQPLQVVMKSAWLDFEVLDWSDLSADECQARFAALRQAQVRVPFDLATPPLMRLRLVRVGPAESWIAWTSHHVILDGWSTSVLMEEVARTYGALSSGRASDLPPPAPYKDYVRYLRDRNTVAAEQHWRQVTADRPVMVLPFSIPARPASGERHQESQRVFSCSLVRARDAAARARVSLNTLLMAAWALVLAPFGTANEVVFGVTSSGRSPELGDIERRVGLYVTTTPMRVAAGTGRVSDWLRSLADAHSRNMAHEHVALTHIQGWAGLGRGEALFETTYAFENYPVAEEVGRLGEAVVEDVVGSDQPHYPLNTLVVADDKLWARCIYDRGRVSPAMAAGLLERFDEYLAWLIDNPDADLAGLNRVSPADRALFEAVNLTDSGYPAIGVHGLVEAAAAAAPHAIAVSDAQGGFITYEQLVLRAGVLAARLAALGVGPDVVVGVRLTRSIEAIVALLAILKAGGAYLGLDPLDPQPRARRLAKIARAALVITDTDLALVDADCPQLLIDESWTSSEAGGDAPSDGGVPDSLAYLAFTSGSTGTPKAVAITHRGVVRLLSRPNFMSIAKSDVFLHLAPLAFDASTLEIWGALIHGAHLALHPPGPVDPEEIVRQVRDRGVTVLWLTAGLFQQTSAGLAETSSRLRQLLVGGDVVSPADVSRILEGSDPPVVINGYGPTEATTFSACHAIATADLEWASLPIGLPVSDARAFVLDEGLQLAPRGVEGQLFIAGDGLARGYLNAPGQTADRFVACPFGPPGARMYATGDRVRWSAEGRLEFLGRRDRQIKIRGHRVELGEIEAVLASCPEVAQVAAVARDIDGERRLVAFLSPSTSGIGLDQSARNWARDHLPAAMVPQHFVVLDALPLNINGKIDRGQLAELACDANTGAYVAPVTDTERWLADLWSEILGAGMRVGRHDDFFQLGGHSLSAAQVVARVRAQRGLSLALRELFDRPTLEAFANLVEALSARPSEKGDLLAGEI